MTHIPKPPPPIKNKGMKEWNIFRQNWLKTKWLFADPISEVERFLYCEKCGMAVMVSNNKGNMMVTVGHLHHIQRRGSHPEKRTEETNIAFLCPSCHFYEHSNR